MRNNCSHSLFVIDDTDIQIYSQVYNLIYDYLVDGYAIVYIGESDQSRTVKNMEKAGINPAYIKKGTITIINSNQFYSDILKFGTSRLDTFSNTVTSKIKNKDMYKGTLGIGIPRELVRSKNYKSMLRYEEFISSHFKDKINPVICCYSTKDIANLPVGYFSAVLDSHKCVISRELEYIKWSSKRFDFLLQNALEKIFGRELSNFIFKVMESAYGVDRNTLISDPCTFENTLRKMLGGTADIVLRNMLMEIAENITTRNYDLH